MFTGLRWVESANNNWELQAKVNGEWYDLPRIPLDSALHPLNMKGKDEPVPEHSRNSKN